MIHDFFSFTIKCVLISPIMYFTKMQLIKLIKLIKKIKN